MMNYLLGGAIMVFVALLIAKIVLDRRGDPESVGTHDAEKQELLTAILVDHLQGTSAQSTVVDTSGRAALALTAGSNGLILVRPNWANQGSGQDEFLSHMIKPSGIVAAETREIASSKTSKDGSSTTMVGTVELLLFLDDLSTPIVRIDFLAEDAASGSKPHLAARTAALEWEALVRVLVFRGRQPRVPVGTTAPAYRSSAR